MKFKTGDKVIIIAGADKGKTGNIFKILKKENKAIINGINLKKKHKSKKGEESGGIIEFSAPIDISNIAIFDSHEKKASKIGYVFDKKGKKNRIFKKTGLKIK